MNLAMPMPSATPAPATELSWLEANQQLLVAEFACIRARLGDGDLEAAQQRLALARTALPGPAAVDALAQLFDLSGFERQVLLLVAGVEMDARLGALCGEAGAQLQRPWACFGLALALFPEPEWNAILPVAPLRRWRLLDLEEGAGLVGARLRIDERVLHFLAGLNHLDQRLSALLRGLPPVGLMAEAHRGAAQQGAGLLGGRRAASPVLVLGGDDPEGQRDVAALMGEALGMTMFELRAADIPSTAHEVEALARLWRREAALLGGGLLISEAEDSGDGRVGRFVRQLDGLVVVAGRSPAPIEAECMRIAIDRPDVPARRCLWQDALGERAEPLGGVLDALAAHHRIGARAIGRIAAQVRGDDPGDDAETLRRLCRGDGGGIPELAQPITSGAGWDDLVLPEGQQRTLRQIAVHARHRMTVHHDWGFAEKSARGLGIATLFAGDSGTGKTLAAEVLANTLGLALYRIDLSAVISKYIGETEKNLRRVFDAAEDIGAILLFDEADALFGKRSEVKDSHDRYANIEVSYLLQRMETYRGLAILTTNHRSALDAAFSRRLRFIVPFPFPDAIQREAIWRTIFPSSTPLQGIDFAKLARLNVAGGTIRNIALNAAFLAADAGTPVTMAHLLRAAHLEASKRDRPLVDAEIRGWT
jgi:hypothetical protein